MILTTTPSVDGRQITEYLGVVTGEAILGANIVRDLFAGVRDIVGGRSGAYEEELRKAREIAMEELTAEATGRGADEVVGIGAGQWWLPRRVVDGHSSTLDSAATVRE